MAFALKGLVSGYRSHRLAKAAWPVLGPALKVARSDSSDEEVKNEVIGLVEAHPEATRAALERTRDSVDPVADRAYRTIRAASEHAPVQPVDPEKEPKLREFERWAGMPLGESFSKLEPIVPGISSVGEDARRWAQAHQSASADHRLRQSLKLSRRAQRLLAKAPSGELVVECGLARRIVLEYLDIALGDDSRGDERRSFAEISATPVETTISFRRAAEET